MPRGTAPHRVNVSVTIEVPIELQKSCFLLLKVLHIHCRKDAKYRRTKTEVNTLTWIPQVCFPNLYILKDSEIVLTALRQIHIYFLLCMNSM